MDAGLNHVYSIATMLSVYQFNDVRPELKCRPTRDADMGDEAHVIPRYYYLDARNAMPMMSRKLNLAEGPYDALDLHNHLIPLCLGVRQGCDRTSSTKRPLLHGSVLLPWHQM